MNEPTFARKQDATKATTPPLSSGEERLPNKSRPARPRRAADTPDSTGALWVCYYRVSTTKQGESGLGLDAQREAVARYTAEKGGLVLAEFTEVESGKKAANRPELLKAMELCRRKRATLAIAKLDRMARNVHFISGLMESNINFVAVDQPTVDKFMMHLLAAFAEQESRVIGQRTREALAAAKRRGVEIGATGRVLAARHKAAAIEKAQEYAPFLAELRTKGIVQVRQVRDELNRRGVPSPGGARWHLLNTHKLLVRLRS